MSRLRLAPWVVRIVIFGGLGLLLLIAIGGRIRADKALHKANEVSEMGTPGQVAAQAQQAVTTFTSSPAVVVSVEREQEHWRATTLVDGECYELAIGDAVSAHPGKVPCPEVSAAGSDDEQIEGHDPRRILTELFLDAWLTGKPSGWYMATNRPEIAAPTHAERSLVTAFYGHDLPTKVGSHSIVTAAVTVYYDDHTEQLGYTLVLILEGERWKVEQVAGGEVPTGDTGALTSGVSPVSSTTTTEGDR